MKQLRHSALAILSGLLAFGIHAVAAREINDRVTAHDLRIRKAREAEFTGGRPARVEETRARSPRKQSILADSILLGNGHNWTLVPKGSVLHLPDKLKKHILKQGQGEILPWQQFLARNRSWLSVAEVDMDTAAGRTPIPEKKLKAWAKTSNIVVAVHRGGAISVRRPPAPAPDKPEDKAKQIAQTAKNPR